MPSCVFRWCTNYTATVKDDKTVSFHALPKDVSVKEKWLKVIRTQRCQDDWLPTSYSTVCSAHFLTSDLYITKKNVHKLKKTAVPITKKDAQNIKISPSQSPSSLQAVNISDEDYIFDTPTEAYLKTKIRNITLQKRQLQSKNYNLVSRNKKLKEKCKMLKLVVSELEKRLSVKNTE